ncbi:integral membrane protein [Streptomyces albus]|uniref:Integral membrane protein n=1 Tax=Streptomyces albus (strain ATCC 21838 / DSM 41398 / FERM P-419 / JCM 4703 / NBRC 107858) TaxID=1081613 RepID=A0A0B5F0X5_STRA4|nr:integral membrane protein [Streptomyces albus]AOU78265.1 integral membrane protein [Streptomyces albus]AYN34017.1 class E sortase [Streptomyces albus]
MTAGSDADGDREEQPAAEQPSQERSAAEPPAAERPVGEEDAAAEPAPAPVRRRRAPGRIATAVGVFGELLITAGLVLGLFVVYSLWWTNVIADRESDRQSERVRDNWAHGDGKDQGPGGLDTEGGLGFLHVPAMSKDEVLVKKGTSAKVLNDGVAGYYTQPVKSALPKDEKGNFSLAAHRDGHGARFHRIDKIKKGDPIVFETKDVWYVYKVYATLPETSKYNVGVLNAIPGDSGREKPGRYLTLTTCTPVFTSRYRYVVWGELVRTEKVDAERTPPKEIR